MASPFYRHPPMLKNELEKIANYLVQPGRVVIDASEFIEPIEKLDSDVEQVNGDCDLPFESRRTVKEILFSTPSLSNYVSGIIINESLVNYLTTNGSSFVNIFRQGRIVPGIKLNTNYIQLGGPTSGLTCEGLDDLAVRCKQYKKEGFHFAQWSSLIEVSCLMPTTQAIQENVNALAKFASICQAYQIVPIIHTDIVHIGIHELIQSQKVTEIFLAAAFKACHDYHVLLKGLVLKINFLSQGVFCVKELSTDDIVHATITALRRTVPVSTAGILFSTHNSNWIEKNILNANDIIKLIMEKYNNLYTITLCINKLNHYLINQSQSTTDDEVIQYSKILQHKILNEMNGFSKASLGIFVKYWD